MGAGHLAAESGNLAVCFGPGRNCGHLPGAGTFADRQMFGLILDIRVLGRSGAMSLDKTGQQQSG
jgi:hypothetical protein